MKQKHIALGLVIVTLIAFFFLVPIVPFTTAVCTGCDGYAPVPSPPCSNPYNYAVSNANLVFQGYESISHYLTELGQPSSEATLGLGTIIYTKCTIG